MNDKIASGNCDKLPVMHHLLAGLKAHVSEVMMTTLDKARRSCGGAGYQSNSGFTELASAGSPIPTYEGDNTVMAQQTLSYIQKKFKKIQQGKPAEGYFAYFNKVEELCARKDQAKTKEVFYDMDHLDAALSIRAAWVVRDVLKKLSNR